MVFALAHATGKVGRFTLIERWRNNERLLAPNENPLKLLLEWGEYANDVQFILQRSENKQHQPTTQRLENSVAHNNNSNTNNVAVMFRKPLGLSNNNSHSNINNNKNTNSNYNPQQAKSPHLNKLDTNLNISPHLDKPRELKKKSFGYVSLKIEKYKTFSFFTLKHFSYSAHDAKHIENIGIVKGIPQCHNINSDNNNGNGNNNLNKQQRNVSVQNSSPTNTNSPFSPHLEHVSRSPTTSTDNNNSSVLPQLIPRHEKSHSNPTEMSRTHTHAFTDGAEFFHDSHQINNDDNNNNNSNNIYQQIGAQNSKSINEINLAVVRESLDRRIAANSPDVLYATPHSNNFNNNNSSNSCSSSSSENLLDIYNGNMNRSGGVGGDMPPDLLYKNAPTISANGALVPPPYRDPPPPRNSPLQLQQQQQQQQPFHTQQFLASGMGTAAVNTFTQDYNNVADYDVDFQRLAGSGNGSGGGGGSSCSVGSIEESDSIFQATQYNDLLQLIKFQREKISAQQLELSKVSKFC